MTNVTLTPHRYKIEYHSDDYDYFLVYSSCYTRWFVEVVAKNHSYPTPSLNDETQFLCWLEGAEKITEAISPYCANTASFGDCQSALDHWKAYTEKFHTHKVDKYYKMRITVEVVTNPLQMQPEADNLFDASKFWKMRVIDSVTLASWDADKQE
jgi:hypothetical protein